MIVLDEDSEDQEDNSGDDEPELFLQTVLMMMFVFVRMKMCHIFANFGAKIRHIFCNLVANYL